jgi:hypothetical protein
VKNQPNIVLIDEPQFPSLAELPFYERDPNQTCRTCYNLVRLKEHPLDQEGRLYCKVGPPGLTTLPGPGGSTAQLASQFSPAHPLQWCFQWVPRGAGGNPGGNSRGN